MVKHGALSKSHVYQLLRSNDPRVRRAACYATTTQFQTELREAMRSLMGLGKRRRLRVDQPTICFLQPLRG